MQSLGSKNYNEVKVHIRNVDDPVTMTRLSGDALMDWITDTKNSQISHVQITDTDGTTAVYSRHDIRKIEPIYIIDLEKHLSNEEMREIMKGW